MSSPLKLVGTVPVRIQSTEGYKQLFVPDPDELPRDLLLSPSHRYKLRLIRDNIERRTNSLATEEAENITSRARSGADPQYSPVGDISATPTCSVPRSEPNDGSIYRLGPLLSPGAVENFLHKASRATGLGLGPQMRKYCSITRRLKLKTSPSNLRKKRLQTSLRSGNKFATDTWKCCKRFQCFQRVGAEECFRVYKEVNSMNPKQAKRYLISLFDSSQNVFRMRGHVVCARFLSTGFHFSNDLQCSIKDTPKCRGSAIALSRAREIKLRTKRVFIAAFIRHLAKLFGDAMPHKEQITLPVLSRKALWMECNQAWKQSGENDRDEELSRNYFYRIWREYADFVSVRKNHGFTQCSKCEMLRAEMAKHLRDEETLIVLIDQHAAHLRFIEKERTAYEGRQALVEENPARYCSIIVDGADQKNYGLPHFATNTKSDSGHKLKVKVVGVLEHVLRGQEQLSLFTMTEEYESGANHIIEVNHRTLHRKKERLGILPPTLFLQVDNCTRENKNRYIMAYLQALVHLGVFKMVQVSFLPIGHTHADIDQAFSSISTHLKLSDAITIHDLIKELRKCYAQRVTATELDAVINFSGLCEQSGCLNVVECFSEYRYFRFVQKDCGDVPGLHGSECDVKVKDSDSWTPFPTSQAEGFLRFVPSLGQTPATETKQLINIAEIDKCLNAAEERVKDDEKMLVLRQMRDKVYQTRMEPFHWNKDICFEMNGDYSVSSDDQGRMSDDGQMPQNLAAHVDNALRPNYGYNPDDFVAVLPCDDAAPFWIARVKEVAEVDEHDRAKTLSVRWYTTAGKDPWEGMYNPAWCTVDGEKTVYQNDIEAASVLVRFESLTAAKKLRVRDKKVIKQTLNVN